ncbi:hypothetical protein RIR_jg19752.t1 [Rhizophagus irregularis DAOM 181602=DAOM 197198]|nr:hypothetical protein RIR_jg19752.t1 [Rhizophagus irregularis DAOM 181602=DAOM 197198]
MMCHVKFIERNWLQSRHFKEIDSDLDTEILIENWLRSWYCKTSKWKNENDSKEVDSNSDMTESGPGWPVIEIKRKNDLPQCSLVHWTWDFGEQYTYFLQLLIFLFFFKRLVPWRFEREILMA